MLAMIWLQNIRSGSHWLWQKIKQHPVMTTIIIGVCIVIFIALAYLLNWEWAGFNTVNSRIWKIGLPKTPSEASIVQIEEQQQAKTLWDWLNLLGILAIPLVVGVGTVWFTTKQSQASEAIREQRARESEANRERRHQTDLEIADKNRVVQQQTELQIAADNQREASLEVYIDKMSELLLEKNLGKSRPEDDIRTIARVRTLTIVRGLDAKRKGTVLRFVQESNLIQRDDPIIELRGANLSGADLRYFSITGVSLVHANLWKADLRFTKLEGDFRGTSFDDADLRYATIEGADLGYATLIHADLSEATLIQTNLRGADLSGSNLSGVDLRYIHLEGASLKGAANVNIDQSNEAAYFLQGTIMPDGSKHP